MLSQQQVPHTQFEGFHEFNLALDFPATGKTIFHSKSSCKDGVLCDQNPLQL